VIISGLQYEQIRSAKNRFALFLHSGESRIPLFHKEVLMNEAIVRQIPLGPFQVNTYVVICPQTRTGVIIDPAGEEEKLLEIIRAEEVKIKYILNTHGHADHVLSNQKLKEIFSVPVCMHEADNRFFADPVIREKTERELGLPAPVSADILLKDKDIIEAGTLRIEVIHTPGHTPGSVCYLTGGNLFTGDTLFVGEVGRTDLTGGSLDTLLLSLRKIIILPKETIVRPGHDYGDTPTSTIGREIEENIYITDFLVL
jgi:glyoxylase-like metal-dependent hydrolase (beta-lactamase superfamily II)